MIDKNIRFINLYLLILTAMILVLIGPFLQPANLLPVFVVAVGINIIDMIYSYRKAKRGNDESH